MKDVLLSIYTDMILSLHTGSINGNIAVSKPLYIITIIEAMNQVGWNTTELIRPMNSFVIDLVNYTNMFMEIEKDTKVRFFVRPYFHLDSAPFYHLIWKHDVIYTNKSITPSAKYLRENLLYAKLDDDLWELLQDDESREYIKQNIIRRYLTKQRD